MNLLWLLAYLMIGGLFSRWLYHIDSKRYRPEDGILIRGLLVLLWPIAAVLTLIKAVWVAAALLGGWKGSSDDA